MFGRVWADRPLLQKGMLVVAIPLATLSLLAGAFLIGLRETRATGAIVQHTLLVREAIDVLLLDLVDAETGVRGFLLTRRIEFVEPYVRGSRAAPLHLKQLRDLVLDNRTQMRAMAQLEPLVEERMVSLKRLLATPPTERDEIKTSSMIEGKAIMDRVRDVLEAMDAEEARLLDRRRADDRRADAVLLGIVILGTILGFCGGVVAVLLFAKTVVRRVRSIERGAHRLENGAPIGTMPGGRDEIGELGRSIGHAATMLAARERALADHAAEVEDLYHHAPCGYHSLDENAAFVRVNDTELRWLGREPDEVIGRLTFPELLTPASATAFRDHFSRFLETGSMEAAEYDVIRRDGSILPVSLSATAVYGPDGTFRYSRSTLFDISERRRLEDALRAMATRDELTGLLNLRGFLAQAEPQVRLAARARQPLLALFADLDGLKSVNDLHGHDAGSRLIAEAAAVLRDSIRDTDIAGRVGGDEFCLILPFAEPEAEARLLDRIRETIARRNAVSDEPFELSISLGAARLDPNDPVELDELIRRADEAMYREKERKRAGRERDPLRPSGAGVVRPG